MAKGLKKKNLPLRVYESFMENESFVASYFCSIKREIMIQGRIYINLNSVIFYTKFFKKTITILIDFKDVNKIQKEKTAYLFPNAIVFCCNSNEKYTFYSFMCRDKVFNLLHNIYSKNLYLSEPLPSPSCCSESTMEHCPSSPRTDEITISDDIYNLFDVSCKTLPPEEAVSCEGHSHAGKKMVSSDHPVSAHKLFLLLFMNSDFIKLLFDKINAYLISISEWTSVGDSKSRKVEYSMKTSTSFGVIVAQIEEEQILEPSTRLGAAYIIRTVSHAKGVMYSDSFHTEMLYCITSNCPMSCHLKIHANLVMKPNTFILARKLITSNGISKITDYCSHIQAAISEKIDGDSETVTEQSDTEEAVAEDYGCSNPVMSFLNLEIDSAVVGNILLTLILLVVVAIYFKMPR